ncbi:MAG: hypothetical protein ACJAWW_001543 [Sulfurimonas sp.]|jgi:hypothetical protein
MIHGFDLSNPLICEGIIGDGCGGGRLFMITDNTLKAYDPTTKEYYELLKGIKNPISISKKACKVTIVCDDETIKFDLSEMKKV